MKRVLSKSLLALAASAAFGLSASPAAAEIVRTASGVLSPGYVQTIVPPSPDGWAVWSVYVTYTPTNTLVCYQVGNPLICNAFWVPGYTKTGNGWEVTKP